MEFLATFWDSYLYFPLFNLLIWLYTGWANYNLGLAIIYLTLMIRIVLLPFSWLDARSKMTERSLARDIGQIQKDFANDPIKQKFAIRQLLKRKHVRHWAKAVVLGVQFLVLLLLYRVFVSGVSSQIQLEHLYPTVIHPDFVNTYFLGFNIAIRNLFLSAIVAGYVFAQIIITQWFNQKSVSRKDLFFSIFFPAFTFLALALLPAVKAVFILTSLLFSTIIAVLVGLFKLAAKKPTAKPTV